MMIIVITSGKVILSSGQSFEVVRVVESLFCILQPLAKRRAPIVVARVNVEFLVVMAPAAFL
jgi:hypothetical protein